VLGTGIRAGRDEIDLVAIEPGPPATLVFVEVRSLTSGRFGRPEESVGRAKVSRLYRAAGSLRRAGRLPDGRPLPPLPWRVDLIAIEFRPQIGTGLGGPVVRHLHGLLPD
jgi:Holliday junction resolvase-like predicted endonuclease